MPFVLLSYYHLNSERGGETNRQTDLFDSQSERGKEIDLLDTDRDICSIGWRVCLNPHGSTSSCLFWMGMRKNGGEGDEKKMEREKKSLLIDEEGLESDSKQDGKLVRL